MSLKYADLHSIPSTICECKSSVKSLACTKTYTIQYIKFHVLFSIEIWGMNSYTAKTQYRKFETNIPRKGIARPQFRHSCVCDSVCDYSYDRSAFSTAGKYVDRSWEYINLSQTHECGIWGWCRAIPFLGRHN
jgi:hypothetical protein